METSVSLHACSACGRLVRRPMIFRQITHDDLGCASYLVGDEHAGVAAVVDPRFEVDEYLELARYMGVSIEHVLETHNHADHVSGHGRLAAATGATIHIHRSAAPSYAHEPLDDGDELELGALVIRALHTPGHRPEHTAFALIDRRRGDDPWAVLTGDTLFVNDVARPDLAIEKTEGAREIFRSLRDSLLTLPAEVEIWPGHLGGSMCGGPGMDMKVSSTIGFERAHNPVLAIADEDEFVAQALAKLGPQPPRFEAIVALNRGPLLTDGVELLPLAPRQVEQKRIGGALLVDVRTDHQFDDAHIAGAICNPMLRAGFGSKLAWLAGPEQEIVFVGRDDEDGRRAGRPTWTALDRPLRTADGWLTIPSATTATHLHRATGTTGTDDLTALLTTDSTTTWAQRLRAADIAATPVCTDLADLGRDPEMAPLLHHDRAAFVRSPWRFHRPTP